jgi:hypothetical protein
MTTRTIKKETSTEVRQVEVLGDSAIVSDTLDLTKYKNWDDAVIIDSSPVKLIIPKKVILPVKKKTIQIDEKTFVDLEFRAVIDSGQFIQDVEVKKVAHQESTVTETIEIETSPNYTKWILLIVAGFIAVILMILIKR